jgi:dTMP kinase
VTRAPFIVFEGGEGAGKSTQSRALADYLEARGHSVRRTREPGGTPAAEAIRAVLLDPANTGLDDRAEALLFAAARGDHAARVIRPALAAGDIVISDRYLDSSVAYQGVARDLERFLGRGGRPDIVTCTLQAVAHGGQDQRIVVDDQNDLRRELVRPFGIDAGSHTDSRSP